MVLHVGSASEGLCSGRSSQRLPSHTGLSEHCTWNLEDYNDNNDDWNDDYNGAGDDNEDKVTMTIVYFRPAGHFCLLATPPEHWK